MIKDNSCMLPWLAKAWQPWQKQLIRIASLFLCVILLFSFFSINSFAADSSGNSVYNGFEVPSFPEGYTYYIFVKGGSIFYVYCSNTPFFYISESNNISSSSSFPRYTLSSGAWGSLMNIGNFKPNNYQIIWSSHDINYSGSSQVYFASSLVDSSDMATFYSYNGFIAPSVFNFDINWGSEYEKHYLIYYDEENDVIKCEVNAYTHYFYSPKHSGKDGYYLHNAPTQVNPYYNEYLYTYVDGEWVFSSRTTSGYKWYTKDNSCIIWSSHDVQESFTDVPFYEGSDAVPLGYDTSFYTILVQGDDSYCYPGETVQLDLVSPAGNATPCKWAVLFNESDLTTITHVYSQYANGVSGLSSRATLNISSSETSDELVIFCTFIDGAERYSTKVLYLDIVPNPDAEYVIVPMGNSSDSFNAGGSFNFQVFDSNDLTYPLYAEWSIEGNNINHYTSISDSGNLSLSFLQDATTITIVASNIGRTGKTATYTINTVAYDFDGTFEDATNKDVIGSIDDGFEDLGGKVDDGFEDLGGKVDNGFSDLGNKVEDMGNNIVTNILEGVKHLFIPTAEELSAEIDSMSNWINDELPILSLPVESMLMLLNIFMGIEPDLGVFVFPEIKWMDNVIISETTLDLNQYSWLNTLLPIIRTTLTAVCCFSFFQWLIRKVEEVSRS